MLTYAHIQARNAQLGVRLEALSAQAEGLRRALAGREGQLDEAQAALAEKDGALRRGEHLVGWARLESRGLVQGD
jgi:multidrug resistance efflux pump